MTAFEESCADIGLSELNDEAECLAALKNFNLGSSVPVRVWKVSMANRPPGCFYHSQSKDQDWYWNSDGNGFAGPCYCGSICRPSKCRK